MLLSKRSSASEKWSTCARYLSRLVCQDVVDFAFHRISAPIASNVFSDKPLRRYGEICIVGMKYDRPVAQ